MLNTAALFACIFLFELQGRLDGFPIPRPSSNRDASLWSTAQPSSDSFDRLWTFPATRLYFSYKRDWTSSTSSPLLPKICRHKRILQSSNGRDLIPKPERPPYLLFGCKKHTHTVSYSFLQPTPTDNDVISSSPSASSNYLRISLPSSERKSRISTTTSYAMRMQSNFRLSKQKEAPMILFDQNGKMYTNFYPPIGHRSNENKQKADDADWGRWYFPKWLTIGTNKT